MTDPVTVAGLALSLATKTTEALTALRERAQRSKDVDIKEQINTLYDNVLQLKDALSRLMDENKELKRQLEQQQQARVAVPKIKQVGQTNYYYLGDEGQFCQPCYDKTNKLVTLSPPKRGMGGGQHRSCPLCHQYFHESPNSPRQTGGSGPWNYALRGMKDCASSVGNR